MKSMDRIPKHYKKGTRDWDAEYDVLLDDGIQMLRDAEELLSKLWKRANV